MSEQWNMNNPGTPPPPGAPSYPPAPPSAPSPRNGFGVAALVLGLVGLLSLPTLIGMPFTVVLCVLAIVFGVLGRKRYRQGVATNRGVATSGLVLGIVGLALTVLLIVVMVIFSLGVFAKVNETVDAQRNKETGLVDGSYQMAPNTWLSINDRCSFTGEVMNVETGAMEGRKTVVGSGATECGDANTVTLVDFTVSGGIADITSVS